MVGEGEKEADCQWLYLHARLNPLPPRCQEAVWRALRASLLHNDLQHRA